MVTKEPVRSIAHMKRRHKKDESDFSFESGLASTPLGILACIAWLSIAMVAIWLMGIVYRYVETIFYGGTQSKSLHTTHTQPSLSPSETL